MSAPDNAAIIADLARAKAAFQLRALTAIITSDLTATANPSAVADSRGARPSGRTVGHAPAVFLSHHEANNV